VKKTATVLGLVACGLALAQSTSSWKFGHRPFKGDYSIYGGGLGDPIPPKKGDKHMAFSITGQAAKDMFNAMGPDLKGVCGTEDGGRIRQRAEVSCSYRPKDGYHCTFGFDLTTGKSIGGSIC